MIKTCSYSDLSAQLIIQYKSIVKSAFPRVIFQSEVVNKGWIKIEKYFPQFQRFLINDDNKIIGIINTIPFYWRKAMSVLPDEGWDWLVKKGIEDYEKGVQPNCLGGLQIIVSKNFLNKGISKLLIAEGKNLMQENNFLNFAIPIRPTFKYQYPELDMVEYVNLKKNDKIYDPWIRTHLKSGAKILKVCNKSMYISGRLDFWKQIYQRDAKQPNQWIVDGALNPIMIDYKRNLGEYNEANVWICYSG